MNGHEEVAGGPRGSKESGKEIMGHAVHRGTAVVHFRRDEEAVGRGSRECGMSEAKVPPMKKKGTETRYRSAMPLVGSGEQPRPKP